VNQLEGDVAAYFPLIFKKNACTFPGSYVFGWDEQSMSGDSEPHHAADFPERETVRRALRGDTVAFQEVVILYGRRLYAIAYGVVQNRTEAEDVVQETFLKAYTRRWMIRDPEKFPAWLSRTAQNQARDVLRKHRPQSLPHDHQTFHEIVDAGAPCPSANLHETERHGAVRRLLSALPDHHRMAITLRFMEGMGYEEVAETMGVSRGALRGILARAMKSLRKGIGSALLPT
jgi:RNA polymerase sigma-70 factor (ECF subfamily)